VCKNPRLHATRTSHHIWPLQFRQALEEAGFHWSCTLIWSKNQFTLSRADYQMQHENLIYGWAPGGTHYWCGKRDQGTIWNIAKPRVNDLHPTQKPVELIERALENSSRANDLVIDFCGGSGSTLIACHKNGRQCRLIEMDRQYADVIVERWQQFSGQTAVLEADGRSFAEVREERRKVAA
jgi:DNA modification methylase